MRAREKGDRGVVQSVVLFLGVSVLSGALAAGLAIPFAGLAGFGTEQAANTLQDLPVELKTDPLSVKSKMVAADGSLIATLFEENRVPVKLAQVNPIMRKAIVSIEDDRFYQHGALDAKGTLRALVRNQSDGGVSQGGSSITQQFVKLSLVAKAKTPEEYAAATAETYQRKIAELRYAVAVEKQFSKDEILEKYLNLANFGDGAYGIEAASEHYFSVHASQLNLQQAAMLAGLVKNPTGYDPTNNAKRAKDRRDVVINRMKELNVVTAKQAAAAIRTPVIDPKKVKKDPNGCASGRYPFYCEWVMSKLEDSKVFGKNKKESDHYIKTAGLTIKTGLDPKVQAAAQASINKNSKATDQAISAVTIVEPGTGIVKAMAQNRKYGGGKNETAYNYNTEKTYAGGYGGFQNGSTMKAFTIAAALQKGIPTTYRINSPDTIDLSNARFSTCDGYTQAGDDYHPKNSTKGGGDITMVEAAQHSTNTYFLQLSEQVGLCQISKVAAALGMKDGQTGDALQQVVSMTLGVDLVTPLMLSNAYATFAAHGKYCAPVSATAVLNASGKPLGNFGPNCKQVIDAKVADGTTYVLSKVMESPGTGAHLNFGQSDLAGKTGTINDNKAVWFSGYSNRLAAASVVADVHPTSRSLVGQSHDGSKLSFSEVSGSGVAGPIWEDAMKGALKGGPTTHFTSPDDKTIRGDVKDIPSVTGMSPQDATNKLQQAGFAVNVAGGTVKSGEQAGMVAWTSPRQSEGAPEGATITLFISDGTKGRQNPPGTPTTPGGPGKPGGQPNPNCKPWMPNYPNCKPPNR